MSSAPEVAAVTAAIEKLAKLHNVAAALPLRIADAEAEYLAAVEALGFPLPGVKRAKAPAASGPRSAPKPDPNWKPTPGSDSERILDLLPASAAAITEQTGLAARAVGVILGGMIRYGRVEKVEDTDPPLFRRPAVVRAA